MKIEKIIITLTILLLFGLGIRAQIETGIRIQDRKILELEKQIEDKNNQIECLQKQLEAPVFMQPVDRIAISSITGIRVNPMGGGKESLHKGVDLVGKKGDPIYAVLSGIVVENWPAPGWHNGILYEGHPIMGGFVIIDHGNQLFSLYGHLSWNCVMEGQFVEAGQKIGEMGTTGISTGNHLHFEIAVDPFRYLQERRDNGY